MQGLDCLPNVPKPERECLERHPDYKVWRSVRLEELHDMTDFGVKLTMAIRRWGSQHATAVGLRYRPEDPLPSVGRCRIFEIQRERGDCANRHAPEKGSETWKFW